MSIPNLSPQEEEIPPPLTLGMKLMFLFLTSISIFNLLDFEVNLSIHVIHAIFRTFFAFAYLILAYGLWFRKSWFILSFESVFCLEIATLYFWPIFDFLSPEVSIPLLTDPFGILYISAIQVILMYYVYLQRDFFTREARAGI
jgi:uncharacterized membrane protein YagU involved in acid resistance